MGATSRQDPLLKWYWDFDRAFRTSSEALCTQGRQLIDRYFKLAENKTTVKQEMLGGLTTFVTMAYIIVVNPQILAQAGMPADGVVFATCISAAAATLVMGLYANYPIALAPGMSLNAYFTYAVCLNMHVPWQTALAVVFFSGVAFLLLIHLCRLPQHACSVADSIGRGFLFWCSVPAPDRDARARTNRQRYARLP